MRRRLAALLLLAVTAAALSGARAAAQPADQEPMLGLTFRGVHRAYPLTLFAARRVLNDVISGTEIAVFHDPEQGVSTAWFRSVFGEPIEFSGEAMGSVADDLTTVTRWDLTTGVAVDGNLEGQRLVPLPVRATSWAGWAAEHPNTLIYEEKR